MAVNSVPAKVQFWIDENDHVYYRVLVNGKKEIANAIFTPMLDKDKVDYFKKLQKKKRKAKKKRRGKW